MASIEHRLRRAGPSRPTGVRRLPATGRLFLVLAAVVAAAELWPIANAYMLGVTEWWSDAPFLLPTAARVGAIVAMPAAVAWAAPSRTRSNPWLWKGALIVAIVQLLRYPAEWLQPILLQVDGEADFASGPGYYAVVVISLALASLSVLGVWALSEGARDAGARVPAPVLVGVGLLSIAIGGVFVPSLLSAGEQDLTVTLLNLVSVVVNLLFLFIDGVLFVRLIAGVRARLRPPLAWRAGALGSGVLLVLPLLSLGSLFVGQLTGVNVVIPFLNVATYFGWPLLAIAVSMGMARRALPAPSLVGTGFVMHGVPRFAQRA
jgi:hypothetical protein